MTEDSRQFIVDIILIVFALERTNQLSLLPDKDVVDLCHPLEPYQVTKNQYFTQFIPGKQEGYATTTKSLPRFEGSRNKTQIKGLWKDVVISDDDLEEAEKAVFRD